MSGVFTLNSCSRVMTHQDILYTRLTHVPHPNPHDIGVFYLVQIFENSCKTSENRGRRSTKPTRRHAKLREGIDFDTIVTPLLPDFEWSRSDACVSLSSRRYLSLVSTKLSKPYLGFSSCDMYDLLQQLLGCSLARKSWKRRNRLCCACGDLACSREARVQLE